MILKNNDLIFKNDLNGSVYNTIKDHVTLGSLSKRATAQLAALYTLDKEVYAAEVKELSQVRISDSARVSSASSESAK